MTIKVLSCQNCFLSCHFCGGDFMEIADNVRKKSWFLVINKKCFNETVNYENMYNLVDSLKPVYAIWNKEKGDKTGNIHMHLYLEFYQW